MDTIVALSSGSPPAAIAVVRASGPAAFMAVRALAGALPKPRRAGLRTLRDACGEPLDQALVLCFPGPNTATGEDLVELHCHGGRAVVAAVLGALTAQTGVREAVAGEFTRRALSNGRIDLAQAQGLADLLQAETEAQRRLAMAATEGRVSIALREWLQRLMELSAQVEATIDFAEEDDVANETATLTQVARGMAALRTDIAKRTAGPAIERIRDGIRVVLAGPPNSGKSTLLNLLADRDAAIVSSIAGTTRDRVEAPVQRAGVAYLLIDTAGLNDADDPIERIGVDRARAAMAEADLLVWLGEDTPPRADALWVQSRGDLPGRDVLLMGRRLITCSVSLITIDALWNEIVERTAVLVPAHDAVPFRREQRRCLIDVVDLLSEITPDLVLVAEHLRVAGAIIARLLGIDATEVMLDHLFSRFCLGK